MSLTDGVGFPAFIKSICVPRFVSKRVSLIAMAAFLGSMFGCASTVTWREPKHSVLCHKLFSPRTIGDKHLDETFERGLRLERECDARCVDCYYHVAFATADRSVEPLCKLHRDALTRLVIAGQQLGRLDPRQGLTITQDGTQICIPIQRIGFAWRDEEFERLEVVGDYSTNAVRCLHQRGGVGLPLVVCNNNPMQRKFLPECCTFPATLTLEAGKSPSLVLHDPKRRRCDKQSRVLASDLSAAYAFRLRGRRSGLLQQFITDPVTTSGTPQLSFVEPYQRGKIPVILVHGLLSNPFTWMQTLTDLESQPWYVENFQTLVYRYPSGQSFLASAAELREQLECALQSADPSGTDPALNDGILVGHSLGGLLSKLLVTESKDNLWKAVANKPVSAIRMPSNIDREVRRAFFFSPSKRISRVVFVGTPHKGSVTANRLVGRIGSALVELPEERKRAHQQLIACNPDTFSPEIQRRIPTSIDLLEPESCLLQAIGNLPVNPSVELHSIIGDTTWRPLSGRSDGVVPVESAQGVMAQSECFVDESHTTLHHHPDARDELFRILLLHQSP